MAELVNALLAGGWADSAVHGVICGLGLTILWGVGVVVEGVTRG